ncbi:MAG: thioredoxin family protein [Marinilabiliaceae bacterium]
MTHEIKILCPGRKCGKCRRMIERVEEAVKVSGVETNIEIVDSIGELVKYKTWILPTLVINGKNVARGYVPDARVIQKHLRQKPEN